MATPELGRPRRRPRQVGRLGVRPHHLGHGVQQRTDLRLAVAGALDGVGVQPQRHVVDEHAAVDLGEVDAPLPPLTNASSAPTTSSRSTPRSSAKWLRVPAGMHAYGRSCSAATIATIACEPSPPGHRQPVGAALHRRPHELFEVVARRQLDGSIPRRAWPPRRGGTARPCRRPTWVVEQHRMRPAAGPRGRLTWTVNAVAAPRQRGHEGHDDDQVAEQRSLEDTSTIARHDEQRRDQPEDRRVRPAVSHRRASAATRREHQAQRAPTSPRGKLEIVTTSATTTAASR